MDWDDAYTNGAYIPGSKALPGIWAAQAAAYRQSVGRVDEGISYGPGPRQKLDLFYPEGECHGLVVFVHGGYWMAFDRSDWSHFAEGARARGWAVALPGYTIAPEGRISAMTQEIGRAIAKAASLVAGPIRLTGHSAGGHLVSRMICDDTPLPAPVLARVEKVVSISGLHDLRPLLRTRMNETLALTPAEAVAESPALRLPMADSRLTCWVGAEERPEFLRQSRLMSMIWAGLAQTRIVEEAGHHHFSIIEGLRDASSALMAELLA